MTRSLIQRPIAGASKAIVPMCHRKRAAFPPLAELTVLRVPVALV
jgi:hypothetical protein